MEKTPANARMWIGTYNNIEAAMCDSYLEKWLSAGCAYVTGQLEKGKEGTPHLQFYLHFPKSVRLSALKKHDKISHFEPVKINNGADVYCNKQETRIDGPWTFGVKPAQLNKKGDKARHSMELYAKGAEKCVQDGDIGWSQYLAYDKAFQMYSLKTAEPYTPGHDRGVWIWGPSRTGKSTYAREKYPDAYDKLQNKWFDGYKGEKAIILDDLDIDALGHHLKRWMDVHPCKGEAKGQTIALQHDWFVVTSNQSITELFKDKPEMIVPLMERCKGRIHHFTEPYAYLKKDNQD